MDETSKVLENLIAYQPQLPYGYQNISPNPPLVDELIDQNLNPINRTLFEYESHESGPEKPLVEKMVD